MMANDDEARALAKKWLQDRMPYVCSDLLNPVATIQSGTQLLQDFLEDGDFDQEEFRRVVEIIRSASVSLRDMIDNLSSGEFLDE
jgi:hypothetical protein